MDINIKLDSLFEQWQEVSTLKGIFIPDGHVDENAWSISGKKVMVLLKETNTTESGWDYQQFIRDRGYLKERTTWANLILWTYGILHGFPSYIDVKERFQQIRIEAELFFRSVYFANIKKIAGGAFANDTIILQAARDTQPLILEQIRILSPNIVLCCGSVVFQGVKEAFEKCKVEHEQKQSNGGMKYIWWNELRTIIIEYHHPNAFYPRQMSYTFLINEIKSIT